LDSWAGRGGLVEYLVYSTERVVLKPLRVWDGGMERILMTCWWSILAPMCNHLGLRTNWHAWRWGFGFDQATWKAKQQVRILRHVKSCGSYTNRECRRGAANIL
jgi:hypothetical protein